MNHSLRKPQGAAFAAEDLQPRLAGLEGAGVTALKTLWREVFGTPAPLSLHAGTIRRAIAYRLQAELHGDLPASLQRDLRRLATPSKRVAVSDGAVLGPGTRLVRVWRGQVYEVAVTSSGFEWDGRSYRSLSRLASEITGTHWNGPRFFGLREAGRG